MNKLTKLFWEVSLWYWQVKHGQKVWKICSECWTLWKPTSEYGYSTLLFCYLIASFSAFKSICSVYCLCSQCHNFVFSETKSIPVFLLCIPVLNLCTLFCYHIVLILWNTFINVNIRNDNMLYTQIHLMVCIIHYVVMVYWLL